MGNFKSDICKQQLKNDSVDLCKTNSVIVKTSVTEVNEQFSSVSIGKGPNMTIETKDSNKSCSLSVDENVITKKNIQFIIVQI